MSLSIKKIMAVAVLAAGFAFTQVANAADDEIVINIKDHKFDPSEVKIKADQKVKLKIKNLDTTAEEFESHDLKREKVVKGGGEITVMVGPLKPGKYEFFGEFNPDSARGWVIVE